MSEKRVVLIETGPGPLMPGLANSLRAAGAEVQSLNLDAYDALLDALEQGWMPVVLKAPLD